MKPTPITLLGRIIHLRIVCERTIASFFSHVSRCELRTSAGEYCRPGGGLKEVESGRETLSIDASCSI